MGTKGERQYSFPESLFRKLRFMENGCVEFTGARTADGYGRIKANGQAVRTHRAMYELLVGPIGGGLTLDHLCGNPPCLNPAHLEPVTMRENIMRGSCPAAMNARKESCPRGHPYDRVDNHGKRWCSICTTERLRRRYTHAER